MKADDREQRQALWNEANRIRIDAMYSGRGHQVVAQRWAFISKLIGLPAAVLSAALSSTAALTALVGSDKAVTATLALAGAGLVAARAFLRPEELADSHGSKGNELINLASDALRYQDVEVKAQLDVTTLRERVEELAERRNTLRLKPPRHIPRWAYNKAKAGVLAGESDYEGDHLWRGWED